MTFKFSQAVDTQRVRDALTSHHYVHVPSILPPENAKRILKVLRESTPWNLVFNHDEKHFDMSVEQLSAMKKPDLNRLQQAIFSQAQQGFQYSYHSYPIFDAARAGQHEGHLLHEFLDWLNDEEFLQFAREATGYDDISFVDAQATRYGPGQFLGTHDDVADTKNRRAAYIFNFTPEWRSDWGGYLQLLDDVGNVRCGLAPTFNALNILTIPQPHNVSFVTPFAGGFRTSISGWFRYGDRE